MAEKKAEAFFGIPEDISEKGMSYLDDYMGDVVELFYQKYIK